MKTLETIHNYVIAVVFLLAILQALCFFANAYQIFPYLIYIFSALVLLIGIGIPAALVMIFMRVTNEEDKKTLRKLTLKWMRLVFFLMVLAVIAKASLPNI